MKRIYPKKNQPVKASEIDRDGSTEQSKQTTLSTGRVRSLATIGLAISVGASGILLPRTGDSARASELAPTLEPTAEVQPASANELPTSVGDASLVAPVAESSKKLAVKVQPGQTLWELSQDYAVAPNALASANGIKSDTLLQIGQKLTIPPTEVVSPQQNAGNTAVAGPEYAPVVNPDQKLDITGSQPSSRPVIQSGPQSTAANSLTTRTLEPKSIAVPNTSGAIDSLKKQENRTAELSQTQLVSESETGLSTSSISLQSPAPRQASSNSATVPVIPNAGFGQANSPIEQSLVTPSLPSAVVVPSAGTTPAPTEVSYRVRPGDTLGAIAKAQGVQAKDLISINKLGNPNLLNINQRLKIPQVGLNNSGAQASASIQASNSTSSFSAASVPASLNPSSSTPEIPGSGVTVSAPSVPIVSPLANLEGLNNVSAPMVPQINNISLTQVSQSISDPRKLDIQGEPTFTGAVNTSALPMPATATASSTLTAADPQPANWRPVSTQGLGTDAVNAVPDSSAATQSAEALSPYAERLRAEVVRLRSEYRAERNAIAPNSVALVPTEDPEARIATGLPSEDNEQLNPYLYTPEYGGTVQNEISRPPSRGWSEEVQKQQQERFDAARAAQSQPINLTPTSNLDRPVVATAPLGAQGYDPLSHPSLGQMVSPELPPLSSPDTYLPNGSKQQQSANGFIWPAKGVFTSGYGWRWGRMHKGIDVAGPIGTPIVAASDGVVSYAQWNDGGYGYLVEITHPDGTETIYAHNSRILVQKGQKVAQGEQISEMGSTGFSTGPHLHFEIHPAGAGAVNPMAFLPKDDSSASR